MEQQVVEMRWESHMDEKKQRGYFQMLLLPTKAQLDQVLERDSTISNNVVIFRCYFYLQRPNWIKCSHAIRRPATWKKLHLAAHLEVQISNWLVTNPKNVRTGESMLFHVRSSFMTQQDRVCFSSCLLSRARSDRNMA